MKKLPEKLKIVPRLLMGEELRSRFDPIEKKINEIIYYLDERELGENCDRASCGAIEGAECSRSLACKCSCHFTREFPEFFYEILPIIKSNLTLDSKMDKIKDIFSKTFSHFRQALLSEIIGEVDKLEKHLVVDKDMRDKIKIIASDAILKSDLLAVLSIFQRNNK